MVELSVKRLLYVDAQLILALSACELRAMVTKMKDSVKKMGIKVKDALYSMVVAVQGSCGVRCGGAASAPKQNVARRCALSPALSRLSER
ncbi:hypothetical protein EVAR_82778_1 [Eumeta japonica]|uniref:Reverse transcriptase domain-containing protein n=1 Tax=Eumeta variegata TaxID=151549 RepID=A0A4C1UN31_EUMVA|nr:hypothetical protein EVAR_82778_1 [Eumeta japonica]